MTTCNCLVELHVKRHPPQGGVFCPNAGYLEPANNPLFGL